MNKKENAIAITSAFLFVFLFNLIVAFKLKMLHMTTDEFGVLAISAYIIGNDWSSLVSRFGYYGYGLSLLYVPFFMLIKNPYSLYTALIVFNSLIVSLIPIVVFHLNKKFFYVWNPGKNFLLTMVTSLYPFALIYSKWAVNETMMAILPWFCIWILAELVVLGEENTKKRNALSVLLPFVISYGYATHGRFIAVLVAVVICVVGYHFITRLKIVNYYLFFGSLAVFLSLDRLVKKHLLEKLWKENDVVNTLSSTIEKFNYRDSAHYLAVLKGALGTIYTVVSSSFGLAALATVLIIFWFANIRKRNALKDENEIRIVSALSIFAVLSFILSLIVSSFFLAPHITNPNSRGDYLIYGRYVDFLTGPMIFMGLQLLIRNKRNVKPAAISILCYGLISFYILFFQSKEILARTNISNFNILGILPYIGDNPIDYVSNVKLLNLTALVIVVFSLITILIRANKRNIGLVILCILFLYTYFDVSKSVIIPNSIKNVGQVKDISRYFHEFGDLYEKFPTIYLIENNSIKPWSSEKYQFALPNYKIQQFSKQNIDVLNEAEVNSIIVAYEDLSFEEHKDVYKIYVDGLSDEAKFDYVWIYGNEIKDHLRNNPNIVLLKGEEGKRKIPINKFYSQINISDNREIMISNGKAGFLLYGPYMTLEKGEYSIVFSYKLLKKNGNEHGFVDVAADKGKLIINKIPIQNEGDEGRVSVDFLLDQKTNDLEFRLFVNENVVLLVEEVNLYKKPVQSCTDSGEST